MTAARSKFVYEALGAGGARLRGAVEAQTATEAMLELRGRGINPTRLRAAGAQDARQSSAQMAARELELFFSQLAKMVGAGLPLERSLHVIEQGAPQSQRGRVAGEIVRALRSGQSPTLAFSNCSAGFEASTLALIKSGETSGDLAGVLAEIEKLSITRNQFRSKLRTALVYPSILAAVALISILTILLVVIPQFETLVESHRDKLTGPAQFVFWLSAKVRWLAVPLAVLAALGGVMLVRAVRQGRGDVLSRLMAKAPRGADMVRRVQSAALLRLLGSLVARQVQLLPALDVARGTLTEPAMVAAAERIREQLKTGRRLADAMEQARVFPALATQLARVGEETGDLGSMLVRAAQMLEDEIDQTSKRFLIWFEPSLLLVIGVAIGGLLYGLFSAILAVNAGV
ncbi:MAG: hypothetical protein RL291_1368 [Pseudomonadota bacterium]